jgi:hypothetical protein
MKLTSAHWSALVLFSFSFGCGTASLRDLRPSDASAEGDIGAWAMDVGSGDAGAPDLSTEPVVCRFPPDVSSQAEVDALSGCNIFEGRISVGTGDLDLSPLASLREIGTLWFPRSDTGRDCRDLQKLEKVGAMLIFRSPTRLQDGLENLREVGLELIITNGPATSLPFRSLRRVKRIAIGGMPNLNTLRGFESLESVERLELAENPRLPESEIEAFLDRVEVGRLVRP